MCVTEAGLRASYCLETSDLFTDLRNIKLRLSCFNREKETAITRERLRDREREWDKEGGRRRLHELHIYILMEVLYPLGQQTKTAIRLQH